MQFEVTDAAAIAFAEQRYAALADGFPVDAALAQARRAIFAAGHGVEFGTPVLFLRSGATQLFEIDAAGAGAVRPSPEPVAPPPAEPAPAPDPESARREPVPTPPSPEPVAPAIPTERVGDQLGALTRWYLRNGLKKLPDRLESGEVFHLATSGELGGPLGTDVLPVLTDRRLLALAARDDRDVAIRIADINSADVQSKLGSRMLTVVHDGVTTRIATLDAEPAEAIGTLLTTLMLRAAAEKSGSAGRPARP